MYNETGFSLQNFIIKVILVVLFVFLLVWLLPMPKVPNMKPVYDRLFAENVETMKDAAKSYYTVERLPKEVDKTEKMTLSEMLSMKLLLPLIDSKGKECDGGASYVEVKKTDTEYLIKISLTCGDRTDYIVEHLGCYDICAKQCVPTQKPIVKTTTKTVIKKVTPVPPVVKNYEYTYSKIITTAADSWSPWKEVKYVDSDNIKFGCTATKCIEVAPNSPRYEQVGTKTTKTTVYKTDSHGNYIDITHHKNKVIGTYNVYGCDGYDYAIYEGQGTYQYTTTSGWSGPTLIRVTSMPSDTTTERYEYVGAGYDDGCVGECRSDYILVNKYVRTSAVKVSSSSTPSSITVTCSNPTVRTANIYASVEVFVGFKVDHYDIKTTNLYGYVKYYRYKTKTQTSSSYTDIQKRSYPDQTLVNNGYSLISVVQK